CVAVVELEQAQPEDAVAGLVAVVDVERGPDAHGRAAGGLEPLVGDGELVEVAVAVAAAVDGEVRDGRGVLDLRVGALAPLAEIEVGGVGARVVALDLVEDRGAEVALEGR